MKAIVLAFLLQLEAIGGADPAMYNINVLAAVHQPIHVALVEGREASLPARFGLATPEGEQKLHAALEQFIRDARANHEYAAARTPEARIDLLFSEKVTTPAGHDYDDYFAFAEAN